MGVYIKRMKMPKECGECPLYSSIDDVCQFDQTDTCYDKKRPLWCPLVDLGKRGDLIDRGKLLRDIEKYHVSDGKFQHWTEIQNAVIEAEGE